MSSLYHIEDVALPKGQDFNALKKEALTYIQRSCGNEWTNFNPSDPGVTILDQLCYALTELGYCTDFPIEDILTKKGDELEFKNQFYKPQEILTTAPVTINDFKRCVLETIAGVDNLIIETLSTSLLPINGLYRIYLLIGSDYQARETEICEAVFLYLNQVRNIGDFFLMPKPLKSKRYYLSGELNLSSLKQLKKNLDAIQVSIQNSIFDKVTAKGYDQLIAEGYDINEIYNGPALKGGWITDEALSNKKNRFTTSDLIPLLQSSESIVSVKNLYIQDKLRKKGNSGVKLSKTAASTKSELIVFNLIEDIQQERLTVKIDGKNVTNNEKEYLHSLLKESVKKQYKKSNALQYSLHSKPSLPKGKYRKIEKYYSIQNTFPEVYAVGENAINNNTPDYKVALSRQLKAYLTLFDQLLANQFSQLENVNKLLSFKNNLTADSADEKRFYDRMDQFEKEHLQYPVPFMRFAPSYFYQSLYKVPDIRALLKGTDAFNFNDELVSKKEQEHTGWEAYKSSPYNPYIHGLMECMESDATAYQRRNNALDHLLARHGQSPELIDAIIKGSEYSGDKSADRIIFKSLYLQNFAHLNYYSQSAYRFLSPKLLPDSVPLLGIKELAELREEVDKDFVFSAYKVDHIEKIKKESITDFYGIALKCNLLLGLRTVYKNYIIEHSESVNEQRTVVETPIPIAKSRTVAPEADSMNTAVAQNGLISQAYWFMQQKGALFIEVGLLLQTASFQLFVSLQYNQTAVISYHKVKEKVSYEDLLQLENAISNNSLVISSDQFVWQGKTYHLESTGIPDNRADYKPITEEVQFYFTASWGEKTIGMEATFLKDTFLILVPEYVTVFSSGTFQARLKLLIESSLAPHISYRTITAGTGQLVTLISNYITWHNSLVYEDENGGFSSDKWIAQSKTACAAFVADLLNLNQFKTAI